MKFFLVFVLESSELFVGKLLVVFSAVFYTQDFNRFVSSKLRVSTHAYQKAKSPYLNSF